jgi:hypothetical protein
MAAKGKAKAPNAHKKLKIEDVMQLGRMLVNVSNSYPTRFLTERDFFPLVEAYLSGRVPSLQPEVQLKGGVADFRVGGPNDTWLELAVQPRQLQDANNQLLHFPGHSAKNALYPGEKANGKELRKLMNEPKGKTRFLLLVDLAGYDFTKLKKLYLAAGKRLRGLKPVRVVYVAQDPAKDTHFKVSPGIKVAAPKH